MRRKVLDTSILCSFWRTCVAQNRKPLKSLLIKRWAKDLVDRYDTDAIVTPVYLEFVAGATNENELLWYRQYLHCFRIIDDKRILKEDWENAQRLAERIPRSGKPRQLGDCLIRAIANRLSFEIATSDIGFPG
jgi:predicted nucleic acid-binding protein